jgi:hypothetical protein
MTSHKWDIEREQRIPACQCPDKRSRVLKGCQCGAVKITIIAAGFATVEYRSRDGTVLLYEPPCVGRAPEEVKAL